MYEKYKIGEWREKSIILGEYAEVIKKSLEYGLDSPLVTLAKLPFPKFAVAFFKGFNVADKFTQDPAFGYKLYLLTHPELELFRDTILYRNGEIKKEYLKEKHPNNWRLFYYINERLNSPLEKLTLTTTASTRNRHNLDYRFMYIAQYIDTKEAEHLGLSIFPFLCADEDLDGFNIEGKLKMLNPTVRTIIARKLGMYGYDIASYKNLEEELGLDMYFTDYFIKELMPYMLRPTGELKNKLKIVERDPEDKGLIEYRNPTYRNRDIGAESVFYEKRVASPEEAKILAKLPRGKSKHIYVASKYFGWTTEQVCRNLTIIPSDIEKVYEII